MNDLEKTQLMQSCNWKPGIQYWKELYDFEVAKTQLLLETLEKTNKKLKLYEKLDYKLRTEYPDKSGYFFISGVSGTTDANGLPEYVSICPAYGADWSVHYKKVK